MEREWVAEESVLVEAPAEQVYALVSDLRRMPDWSPELFAIWVRRRGFTGFNRRGPYVWWTGGRVTADEPCQVFAFRVTSFRMPVALWGYRFESVPGGTRLTEYWQDLRRDTRSAAFVTLLGRLFTGVRANGRAAANRDGMRATLERIRRAATSSPADQ